jgi:hypothetical protein
MQFDSRCSSQQVEKRVRMGGGDGRWGGAWLLSHMFRGFSTEGRETSMETKNVIRKMKERPKHSTLHPSRVCAVFSEITVTTWNSPCTYVFPSLSSVNTQRVTELFPYRSFYFVRPFCLSSHC